MTASVPHAQREGITSPSLRSGPTSVPHRLVSSFKILETRRRGIIFAEVCVSLALVGLILVMVSLLVTRYSRATDYYMNYRRVQLGVESQVERMRAGLLSVHTGPFTDKSGISYEFHVEDAPSQWAPLKSVVVIGRVTGKHSRQIRFELRTFVGVQTSDEEAGAAGGTRPATALRTGVRPPPFDQNRRVGHPQTSDEEAGSK